MRCEKCGKEIDYLLVNVFQCDGSDRYEKYIPAECDQNAVYLDLDSSWTGYDLTEKEQRKTILCPYCKTWPFENKEVQQHKFVRVVGFKKENRK